MDTRKIRKLIELVKETGIVELEVKSGDESVRISAHSITPVPNPTPTAPFTSHHHLPQPEIQTEESTKKSKHHEGHTVKSPMVGTVYLASAPGAKPFVSVGQHVETGDTLCMVEAMKMFNKIEADCTGVISARLVENEQPIEYDQPLFIIDTNE